MHWLIDPIQNHYADFTGRASRKAYWMFVLYSIIAYIVCGIAVALLGQTIGLILLASAVLVLFIPSLALQVRRLHDVGWSGWWIFLSLFPYIGGMFLIILYCLPSQKGTNKYGSNKYGVENPVQPTPQTNEVDPHTT